MILLYVAFIVLKYDTSDTSFYHKGMLNIGEHVFFFFLDLLRWSWNFYLSFCYVLYNIFIYAVEPFLSPAW
jgi:hypothetical protein